MLNSYSESRITLPPNKNPRDFHLGDFLLPDGRFENNGPPDIAPLPKCKSSFLELEHLK